ncbi:class I SAM-dependent methyltransferase [Pseudoduganella sp. RAF53_2]|uniref:class I SAM-dependent methyltransferase n=1 Tax=unclassified Pseudoduganella TaxID=2637179 RepID=UPI003F9B568C
MTGLTAAPQLFLKFARWRMRNSPHNGTGQFSAADVASALYTGILGRAPDAHGLTNLTQAFELGKPIDEAMQSMIGSSEFSMRMIRQLIPGRELPDLTQLYPDRFVREDSLAGVPMVLYNAFEDADFNFMESLIVRHRYYDMPGVWGAGIGLDQHVTAAIAQGLGARRCMEIGCFTGGVLSLLEQSGIDVTGLDVSHLAFMLAFPNVRDHMIFGDLLSAPVSGKFDVVLAMDIIEHLNPVKFDLYLARLAELIDEDGYFYLNSPMFGSDEVFGQDFEIYVRSWLESDNGFFRQLDCDEKGWPKHGHLVWATPQWWEERMAAHGLVRDREIERAVHAELKEYFELSPARRSLFVLKHAHNRRNSADVAKNMRARLAAIPGLAR